MYPKYFGLKEPSFSITPDPHYLFLSGQHREALAHLLFGAGGGGGFVLLTGEVGTGKTTVCRAFLEQLPEGVDVALVLNPAMTATELLHAICDEFRVALPSGEPSVKTMLDHLNRFLLDAHARGRRPVLIIDEAQNLRPKVLEQIRLLTNLETSKQKLLQIFLIGQPELRVLLASPDLRQLNQRVTARYHLTPLGPRETAAYVDHRIAVAGVERPLFTPRALKRVHRHTRGVPRLINLLCDRALLGAAVSRRMQVTPGIVDAAAREVIDRADPALPRRRSALATAAAVLMALGLGVLIGGADLPQRLPADWVQAVPAQWLAAVGWQRPDADPDPSRDPSVAEDDAVGPGAASVLAQTSASAADPDAAADTPDAGTAADASVAPIASVAAPAAPGADPDAAGQTPQADLADAETLVGAAPEADSAAATTAEADTDAGADAGAEEALAAAAPGEPAAQLPAAADTEATPAADPETAADAEDPAEARPPRIATARVAPQAPTLAADRLGDALIKEDAVVDELLRLWQVETAPGVRFLDCAAVPAFALACERSKGRWSDLRRFDRPAALKLRLPGSGAGFVVVGGLDEEHALLYLDGAAMRVPIAALDERWSGDYLMLWRPPPYGGRVIGVRDPADAIAWLRERLALLPGSELTVDPARYDADVTAAVRRFQDAQGLIADGIAGPRTLIMLSNALADLDVPRLSHSR
ncbi:AAA family ATPase [uncultured Thiohalocapsa sp.]|uniref:AAA family ATPase n=1 Tax=uncultured Thiohalocapsa sp. TaxID=768990 RepID=UPI0025F4AC41|nr:AAA family ATPase [uncultured Thiohalocapsa sp.]